MFGQRRRRWANIKKTLSQYVVFAGILFDFSVKHKEKEGDTRGHNNILSACTRIFKNNPYTRFNRLQS